NILRQLKGHELLDEPLRLPQRIVAAEENLVWANPEEQIRDDLGKVAWTRVNEWQSDGYAAVDVRFLGGDPAEVLQARQSHMFHNEGQLSEPGGRIVYVGNVKGIAVEWVNGWPLMDVDVGDAEFATLFEIAIGGWVGELIALGVTAPLCRIKLDALDVPFAFHAAEIFQPCVAVAGIPGTIENIAVGVGLLHHAILLNGVEAIFVEILQICGLENGE